MKLATFCLGTLAVGFVVHLIWWRIQPPAKQLPVLLGIFLLALPVTAGIGLVVQGSAFVPTKASEWFQVLVVCVPVALAYVATYSAVEEDSPSLRIVKYVRESGAGGRSREDLNGILDDDVILGSRFAAMMRDGLIYDGSGGYALTPLGRRLADLVSMTFAWLGIRDAG